MPLPLWLYTIIVPIACNKPIVVVVVVVVVVIVVVGLSSKN